MRSPRLFRVYVRVRARKYDRRDTSRGPTEEISELEVYVLAHTIREALSMARPAVKDKEERQLHKTGSPLEYELLEVLGAEVAKEPVTVFDADTACKDFP